jgi:hypothetical protein
MNAISCICDGIGHVRTTKGAKWPPFSCGHNGYDTQGLVVGWRFMSGIFVLVMPRCVISRMLGFMSIICLVRVIGVMCISGVMLCVMRSRMRALRQCASRSHGKGKSGSSQENLGHGYLRLENKGRPGGYAEPNTLYYRIEISCLSFDGNG